MTRRVAFTFAVLAALFAGAAVASAAARRNVTLDRDAIVGGRLVPAGSYALELPSGPSVARFVQGQRIVAEVPCHVGPAQSVYDGNAMHYQSGGGAHDQLIKIVFGELRLAVEFPTETAGATEAPAVRAANRP